MQIRRFLPTLCAALFGASRAQSKNELPVTDTSFSPVTPLRNRGNSPKLGCYFRNRNGRTVRSHNPKFRKKLRYGKCKAARSSYSYIYA